MLTLMLKINNCLHRKRSSDYYTEQMSCLIDCPIQEYAGYEHKRIYSVVTIE